MSRHRRRLLLSLPALVGLAGCASLAPPPPREVFDTGPIAATEDSAPLRLSPNPDHDEDPALVRTADGTFHVVWSAKQEGKVDLFVRSSRDGRTWSDAARITTTPDADFYPALVEAADGSLHLTWFLLQRKGMSIWHARSLDGLRWSEPTAITEPGGVNWGPAIYEDAQRLLWILWSSDRTGNRELFASSSEDGGRSWSTAHRLTDSPGDDDFPHVLESRGERLLVWTRYRNGSSLRKYYRDGTAEVVCASSRDGLHWSDPTPCSPADPGDRQVDFLPVVFADSTQDRVYLSWTSSRPHAMGDILVRELESSAPIRQLTASERSDYDAKIVATGRPDEYLMVWVSNREGKTDIFVRLFRL